MKANGYDLSSARRLLASLLFLAVLNSEAADIATKPLIIPSPPAPNVILTVEENGSMRYATPPYLFCSELFPCDRRHVYSSHFNPLYYNPAITYQAPKKPDGSDYTTAYGSAWKNGYDPESGVVNLGEAYRPTLYYDPVNRIEQPTLHPHSDVGPGKPFPTADAPVPAYYYRFNPGPGCDPVVDKTNDDCYSIVWVGAEERQNFANWYSFYRTRYLATITALHLTMPKLEGKIRLAWQGNSLLDGNYCRDLSGSNCKDRTGDLVDNSLKPFQGTHRDDFYRWLSRLGSGGIGLNVSMRAAMKRAGDYLSHLQRYCENPDSVPGTANPARSCRDNVHIIVSDGQSRDAYHSPPLPAEGDVDSTAFDLGESGFAIAYVPRVPYMDYPLAPKPPEKNAYTVADLALYYWARDLVPDLENNLLPYMPDQSGTKTAQVWNPRNNPATWQHLVNYAVITGMSFVLGEDWGTNTYDGKQALGEKNWPKVHASDSTIAGVATRVYDYWHAALNSRGQFYGVDEVDRLIDALGDIMRRVEKRLAATAAIAANSTRIETGTVLYQARYTAAEWWGEIIASKLDTAGTLGATLWTASIPAPSERNLVTHDGSVARAFNDTDTALLPSDWASQVGVVGASASEVLAWLRGDQSQEQSFDADGNHVTGKYRKRTSLLGDIVNSDPAYVGHQDYGYASLPEAAGDAYKNFVTANKNRVKMLYVGANDGMLHGFVAGAGTGAAHACGGSGMEKLGQELFAYIPKAAREKMPVLANPDYGRPGGIEHRYLVDGPVSVGDAFVDGAWKTILLGTTGAGGRAIFALDVTNPCDFGPAKVLWEHDETWSADLGYTLAKPIIARLNNGKWAAVFGNGYNSGSGKAVLFVVDLATGALIKKFDLGGSDNGLAAPSLYDADGNGTTDFIYAGDLQGRLWKIDVSAGSEDGWAVAFGGSPLFMAVGPDGEAQPITAAPELGKPPGASGVMVYFGTGRFFVTGDEVDHSVQSLYGLLDKGSAIAGRANLVAQSIVEETTVGGKSVRKSSANTIDYATKSGWYLDLDFGGAKGERVISTPRRVFSRVFFTTIVPEADPCKFGGASWLIELDYTTGGMPTASSIDIGGGEVLAGVMSSVGIVKSFEFLSGEGALAIGLGSTGATEAIRLIPPSLSPRTGRISWREIID